MERQRDVHQIVHMHVVEDCEEQWKSEHDLSRRSIKTLLETPLRRRLRTINTVRRAYLRQQLSKRDMVAETRDDHVDGESQSELVKLEWFWFRLGSRPTGTHDVCAIWILRGMLCGVRVRHVVNEMHK